MPSRRACDEMAGDGSVVSDTLRSLPPCWESDEGDSGQTAPAAISPSHTHTHTHTQTHAHTHKSNHTQTHTTTPTPPPHPHTNPHTHTPTHTNTPCNLCERAAQSRHRPLTRNLF